MKINWVDLMITNRCNMRCSYCFHEKTNTDMLSDMVIKASLFLKGKVSDNVVFNLFGGEPFMRPGFCRHCIDILRAEFPECLFCISTNALLFDMKLCCHILEENKNNTIQISHDGVAQEITRGYSCTIEENVKKYIDLGRSRISFRLTFIPETVSTLFESIEYLYSLGARSITHQADFKSDWTEEYIEIYKHNIDKLYVFLENHKDLRLKYCGVLPHGTSIRSSICGAGREMIAIDTDGSIYPCHRFVGNKRFVLGDVVAGSLNRGRFMNLRSYVCDRCEAVSSCHQCIAANYDVNGALLDPIKPLCEIMKYEHSKYKIPEPLITEDNIEICSMCMELLKEIARSNQDKDRLFNEKFIS